MTPSTTTAFDLQHAGQALRRGDWIVAEQLYRKLAVQAPARLDIWLEWALTLTLLTRRDEAITVARRAICLAPAVTSLYTLLNQILIDAGKGPEDLAPVLAAIIRLEPTSPQIAVWHARYAEALFRLGALDRALIHCDAALLADPEQQQAQQTLTAIRRALAESEKQFKNYLNFFSMATRAPAPYVMFHGGPHEQHDDGRLDAMGFRNRLSPTVDKPAGEIRVFVLGDSTMFHGRTEEETVAGVLQTMLNATGRHYAVYNFGMISGCVGQMLALLLFRLIELKPDIVIVHAGAIDLFAPLTFDPRPGNPYNFHALETLYGHFFANTEYDNAALIVRFSEIAKAIIARQASLRAACGWKTPAWEDALIDSMAGRIDRLRGLSAGFGFKTAFLLQPLIMFKDTLTAQEAAIEVKDDFRAYMCRQYDRLRARLMFSAADPAPTDPFILQDISRIFSAVGEEIHEDFIHYNPRGRQIVAARMRDIVLTLAPDGNSSLPITASEGAV